MKISVNEKETPTQKENKVFGKKKGKRTSKKDFVSNQRNNNKGNLSPVERRDIDHNDPSYYFKFSKLANTVSRVPFNHRNGGIIELVAHGNTFQKSVDPIVVVDTMLTPGLSEDSSSGINLTAQATFKMLNRRFRGVYGKYQAADLGIVQFALCDLFASIAELERIYGLLMHYSVNQRNIPYGLLVAMGVDPESFTDLADFRYQLNKIIISAKTLCLVRGYSLLDHATFMYSNLFKDKDTDRAQLFAFVRNGYWKWNPTNFNTGSALIYTKFSASTLLQIGSVNERQLRTQDDMLKDLRSQLNALLQDDDVDQICSDILAFYGNKEDSPDIVKLGQVPEEYEVTPIYAREASLQFHNMVAVGNSSISPYEAGWTVMTAGLATALDSNAVTIPTQPVIAVYQVDGVIKFNLYGFNGGFAGYYLANPATTMYLPTGVNAYAMSRLEKVLIDTDQLDPSPEEVMEMTRLTTLNKFETYDSGNKQCGHCISFGTIVPVVINAYVFRKPGIQATFSGSTLTFAANDLTRYKTSSNVQSSNYTTVTCLSKLDWAPILYVTTSNSIVDISGDIDNYVPIDHEILNPIHEVAVMSELRNPIMETLVTDD